ncbi:MAG: hypothetical protein M1833_004853 [Piccolia ochrophora]|nr:MAG: hypothetical protein M1833_004853 [Piccolia ochrophora]
MYGAGLLMDFEGRLRATGGNNARKTSVYASGSWSLGPDMAPACSPAILLPPVEIKKADPLSSITPERILERVPAKAMNWFRTTGSGSQSSAGDRNDDSMCGDAAMYDAASGKILTVGGGPDYQGAGTDSAHIVTLNNTNQKAAIRKIGSMAYKRIFSSAVVLPDGQVLVVGGQSVGDPSSDDNAILTPELFSPATNTFTKVATHSVPRAYNSFALLRTDGAVLVGCGSLRGSSCSSNHFDAQDY